MAVIAGACGSDGGTGGGGGVGGGVATGGVLGGVCEDGGILDAEGVDWPLDVLNNLEKSPLVTIPIPPTANNTIVIITIMAISPEEPPFLGVPL